MDTFFQTIVSNAVLATILAVVVAAATRFVRRPEVVYWLWVLVLLKLVTPPIVHLPISFGVEDEAALAGGEVTDTDIPSLGSDSERVSRQDAASPFNIVPESETAERTLPEEALPGPAVLEASEHAEVAHTTTDEASEDWSIASWVSGIRIPWAIVVLSIWLLGSVLWFALAAVRLCRFGRFVRRAELAREYLQVEAQRLAERFGLRRIPQIRVLAARVPPLVWRHGRRAVIVLPRDLLDRLGKEDQAGLVAHELAHYRRGDHLRRWFEAAMLGLYWWHPVVWLARRRLHQAEEQCCDAWVLWAVPGGAKGYAHALLTTVEFLSCRRPATPAVAAGFGQVGPLTRRLEMIVGGQTRRRMSLGGFVVVGLSALLALPWSARAVPAEAPDQAPVVVASEDDTVATERAEAEEMLVAMADKDESETVDAASLPERVKGKVLASDGSPVAGARVYLVATDTSHPMLTSKLPIMAWPSDWEEIIQWSGPKILGQTRTDASGCFDMPIPPAMPKDSSPGLIVAADGFGLTAPIAPTAILCFNSGFSTRLGNSTRERWTGDLEVRLPKAVPIQGHLLTPKGTPAAGALVTVRGAYLPADHTLLAVPRDMADENLPEYWPKRIRTDADGAFTLTGMPAESYVALQFTHPDFAVAEYYVDTRLDDHQETNRSEQLPPKFRLAFKRLRPVEGQVTKSDTGEPLADVLVAVVASRLDSGGRGYEAYARTDEEGRYRVNSREGRDYSFTFYPSHDSGYLPVSMRQRGRTSAERLVKDIQLDPGRIVRGRVVDQTTGKRVAGASIVYRYSKKNLLCEKEDDYNFQRPVFADETGQFALTVPTGPGYLLVEVPDGPYVRSPDIGDLAPRRFRWHGRMMPMGLTSIEVPSEGALEEVVIRLRRGRTVKLQAVKPDGEALEMVRAKWEGNGAQHDHVWTWLSKFTDGKIEITGLDPERTTRVLMIDDSRKLGAIYDITPQTPAEPVLVRLQPTATIVGQCVTRDGTPVEDAQVELFLSFDPRVSQFTKEDYVDFCYSDYYHLAGGDQRGWPPHADGKFTLENVVPDVPLGLMYGIHFNHETHDVRTIQSLKPGQRFDVGKLVTDITRDIPGGLTVAEQPFTEARAEGGELKIIQGIPVLFLAGDPEEMGRQQGALLVEPLRPLCKLPKAIVEREAWGGAAWPVIVGMGRGAMQRVPDRFRRELDAASGHAKISKEEADALIALNALFEVRDVANCSAFIVEPERSATGQMLFGRNLDLPSYGCTDRLSLVTIYRPKGRHAFASVGFPGFGGVISGINDAGLAIAALSSYESADGSPELNPLGTPLYLTFRRILEECSTIEEAHRLLRGGKYTTWMILAACDTQRSAVFEITTKDVVTRRAEDHLLAATNQFRTPQLSVRTNSSRYAKLEKYWQRENPLTRSDVAQAMRDARRSNTLHTMIFEPKSLKLHLAISAHPPATSKPLVTLNLAELFKNKVDGSR